MSYIRECNALGVNIVSKPDMDEIISYFKGEIESSENIDETLRKETLIQKTSTEESKISKKTQREVLERPLCTKESMLQTPNVSYKYLIDIYKDFLGKKRKRETAPMTLLQEIKATADHSKEFQPFPILVVTNAVSGNITIANVKQFLEKSIYQDPSVISTPVVTQPIIISKNMRSANVTFEVFDQTFSFTKYQWKKVVGVFVQGPRYQFKDWPQGNDLVSLFSRFKGFYLKLHDVPVDENVKKLNVRILEVHRNKRHLDKTVVNEFWNEVDRFLFSPRNRG